MSGDYVVKKIPDNSGNTLTVVDYKGRLWPEFPVESISGFQDFKVREDDIFMVAYPKSGTHWVFEMVRCLLAGTVDLPVVEKDDTMIEDADPKVLEGLKSPRNLNTHCHFELLPAETLAKKPKFIHVTRDPRDVAVSYFNHHKKLVQYYDYHGEWKDYFPLYLDGRVDYESWFAYTKGWEEGIKNHPELSVYVTTYEKLHEDTEGEIERIAEHIGVKADKDFIKKVVQKSSFDSMKKTKGQAETFERRDGEVESIMYRKGEAVSSVVDTQPPIMYRKGKVGDWKNWFTVAQSELFDRVFEKEMAGSRYYKFYSRSQQSANGSNCNRS